MGSEFVDVALINFTIKGTFPSGPSILTSMSRNPPSATSNISPIFVPIFTLSKKHSSACASTVMKYAEQLLKRTQTAARRASHVVVEEGDILRCEHYLEELRE